MEAPALQTLDESGKWTLLCVDDEPNILSSLRRLFRASGYKVLTAEGGDQALALLAEQSVDLVISDMRMPHMDGAQLLEQIKDRWPSITRLLLTGYADVASTIAAINRGQIHRYMNKPWNDDEVLLIVKESFERKQLERDKQRLELLTQRQNEELKDLNANLEFKVEQRTAELGQANDRLKKGYMATIKAFSSLIEQRGPHLVGHARKVADVSRRIAMAMNLDEQTVGDVFIAGLLHDVGQVSLPDVVLVKPVPKMADDELKQYRMHPLRGEQTLMSLDDLQGVSMLIRSHHERYDGQGFPDRLTGEAIPLGARILAVAETYDDLQSGHLGSTGLSPSEARVLIEKSHAQFDPIVVSAFLGLFKRPVVESTRPLSLTMGELRPGMVLAKDFMSDEGVVLLAADFVLTADMIARLRAFERKLNRSLLLSVRPASASEPGVSNA
ncbi:MAG TPA: HD domain-containing phosphohydrolase [Aquabacterium sp.]|uniref:HD domain-containing phosphohydrolase n=1 Tax=Aquabacterium sp. TaxID=1872578 RepID=UPI002E378C19|nr:HD domain-containing phosphohydrolase [Aquabacterium sp.]HEX5354847.1 HD domain-containing phosphohydrolase [Aquabacterium sp.]